jgi:hypothetical protein
MNTCTNINEIKWRKAEALCRETSMNTEVNIGERGKEHKHQHEHRANMSEAVKELEHSMNTWASMSTAANIGERGKERGGAAQGHRKRRTRLQGKHEQSGEGP